MKRPHRKLWTPEDDQLLRTMIEKGKSATIIAAALKRTVTAVKGRTSLLRLSRKRARSGAPT